MKPHIWTRSSGGLQSRVTPRGQVGGQECLVSTAELPSSAGTLPGGASKHGLSGPREPLSTVCLPLGIAHHDHISGNWSQRSW